MEDKRRLAVAPVVRAINDDRREILHQITSGAVDRMGDVVDPKGADTANFMKNPVVLVNHDYSVESIIGKAVALELEEDAIYARTQFLDTPLAQAAYNLAKEGIGGWSIGFRPKEWDSMKDEKGKFKGFHFKAWELLEYSSVAIPANQEIVNHAVQRGLIQADDVPLFFQLAEALEPPSQEADHGTTAEPEQAIKTDLSPLTGAIERAVNRIERAEIARKVREAAKRIKL